jgi:hypothetical protein
MRSAIVFAIAACTAAQPRPPDGAIGGLTRDRATGDPIGFTTIHLRGHGNPITTIATREGLFGFDHLAPGRYALDAQGGSARATIDNIDVKLDEATVVDVELGAGSAVTARDFTGDRLDDAIEQFTPANHDATTGIIEGAIADSTSRHRVAGAVITLLGTDTTLQTVSDEYGRYRFDAIKPGTYTVSAYYSVDGHGQIEVRRSDIAVTAAHGVRVPLWVETRQ